MTKCNHFLIRNDFGQSVTLNIEPEGFFYCLGKGEEVSVKEVFTAEPVTIKFASSDSGEPLISIWPGDGDVRVEKDGTDLFNLVHASGHQD